MKATEKKFYSIEEFEQEDMKKSWIVPSQYRCFFNCIGRIDKKKYKTVPCPDHSPPTTIPGSFPVVTLANDESKDSIAIDVDDENLLMAFQQETTFNASNWILDDFHDVHNAVNSHDDTSDYFSVCPVDIDGESTFSNTDIFFRRHSHFGSLNSEMEYITEDESVNTLENILLQEVSGWVPFDSVSFSPSRRKQHRLALKSTSPRTPTTKNAQIESHGTPATENTQDSHSHNMESVVESVEDMLVAVPTLSDLDHEENDSFHYGQYGDHSVYDYYPNDGSDLSEESVSELLSTSTMEVTQQPIRKTLDKDNIVHSPPNPNRHRQEINRFFQKNEVSQSFDMDVFSEGEFVPEYLIEFHPYKNTGEDNYSDSHSCSSQHDNNESCTYEKIYRHSFEDIGSRNNDFDALYHSSMSSL